MDRLLITGGAGLVGFNLCYLLQNEDYEITIIDKSHENISIFKKLFPSIKTICADLSQDDTWKDQMESYEYLIVCHAQISSLEEKDFINNNIISTKKLLNVIDSKAIRKIIHISSSVINSEANDYYVTSKKEQEDIIKKSKLDYIILRPTLMFGWFDKKHLGWLAKFMKKFHIFPIPGDGKYIRQPLFVLDFCKIIISALKKPNLDKIYDISGKDRITYIEIIKKIREVAKINSLIIKIPYNLFYFLINLYSYFDKNPPFTVSQLEALVIPETFKVIDWENIFEIKKTNLEDALDKTLNDKRYSKISLKR